MRADQYRRQKKTDETIIGQRNKTARPRDTHDHDATHMFNLKHIKLPKPKEPSSMPTYRSDEQEHTVYTQGRPFRTKEAAAATK